MKIPKHTLRLTTSAGIVLATILVVASYLRSHRSLLARLAHISPWTIAWVLLLYSAIFVAMLAALAFSMRIARRTLHVQENILLNAYTIFANFFLPGQGGPAIRGIYLKKRHRLLIRNYLFVTLLYYACYATVSGLLLFVRSRPWWWTILAVVAASGVSAMVLYVYWRHSKPQAADFRFTPEACLGLLAATAVQCLLQVVLYAIELHSVDHGVTLSQATTYAGAAGFSLFVSLTPGAIGVRESFLLFSQRLHHISSADIVAANVIDRAIYLVFLGILFLLLIVFHANSKLRLRDANSDPDDSAAE